MWKEGLFSCDANLMFLMGKGMGIQSRESFEDPGWKGQGPGFYLSIDVCDSSTIFLGTGKKEIMAMVFFGRDMERFAFFCPVLMIGGGFFRLYAMKLETLWKMYIVPSMAYEILCQSLDSLPFLFLFFFFGGFG